MNVDANPFYIRIANLNARPTLKECIWIALALNGSGTIIALTALQMKYPGAQVAWYSFVGSLFVYAWVVGPITSIFTFITTHQVTTSDQYELVKLTDLTSDVIWEAIHDGVRSRLRLLWAIGWGLSVPALLSLILLSTCLPTSFRQS